MNMFLLNVYTKPDLDKAFQRDKKSHPSVKIHENDLDSGFIFFFLQN